jgi:Fe2+ or Zn2+ uptake regulation protein
MYYGTLYITAQNTALRAFTDLSRHDVIILQLLSQHSHPVKYSALYSEIILTYSIVCHTAFSRSLRKLVRSHYLNRLAIGNKALYSITVDGRYLLTAFNITIDEIVKANIMQYGNGLTEQ